MPSRTSRSWNIPEETPLTDWAGSVTIPATMRNGNGAFTFGFYYRWWATSSRERIG
jgi:hypothetical protein